MTGGNRIVAFDAGSLDADRDEFLLTEQAETPEAAPEASGAEAQEWSEDWADAPRYIHPAVIVHPGTGRRCLLVNRLMADSVVGMPRAESDRIIEELCQASERPAHIYEHVWRAGDLLIWDNRCTLHARTDFDPAERRVLRRMAIRGQRPIPAVAAA